MPAYQVNSRVLIVEADGERAEQYRQNVVKHGAGTTCIVPSIEAAKARLQADKAITHICLRGQRLTRLEGLERLNNPRTMSRAG